MKQKMSDLHEFSGSIHDKEFMPNQVHSAGYVPGTIYTNGVRNLYIYITRSQILPEAIYNVHKPRRNLNPNDYCAKLKA